MVGCPAETEMTSGETVADATGLCVIQGLADLRFHGVVGVDFVGGQV